MSSKKKVEGPLKSKKKVEGPLKSKKKVEGPLKSKKKVEGPLKSKKKVEGPLTSKKKAGKLLQEHGVVPCSLSQYLHICILLCMCLISLTSSPYCAIAFYTIAQ